METNIIILFFAGSALLTALTLLRLQRKKRLSARQDVNGLDNALERIARIRGEFPAPTDQKACDRIEAEVRAVNRHFSMSTSIAPKKVYEMAAEVTRKIAGVYYPEAENPALEASISDLLRLNERVVTRLNLKVEAFPLKAVKDIHIQRIMKGKDYYDTKIKNKIEWFKKYELLYKIGNRAWLSYNVLNPWYWSRQIAYTSVREITFRSLLTWVITIVGEEAMAVYSKRDINTRDAAFERDLAFAMIDMALTKKDASKETYAVVLDHVLNKARLNDALKVDILRFLTVKGPGEKFTPAGDYTKKQTKRLLDEVERVATACGEMSPESRERLDALKGALAAVSDDRSSL